MFAWFRRWRRGRILARQSLDPHLWRRTLAAVPLAAALAPARQAALRDLVTLFLDQKDFYGGDDFVVDENHAAQIAAQACIPALGLGYDALEGWYSIYLYPGQFRTRRGFRDEAGLVGEDHRVLSGEAQYSGGIVLSWDDVAEDIAYGNDGSNVVIHEVAHKFDMLNSDADGYPPLHRSMSRSVWARVMQAAFDDLNGQLDAGRQTAIDPYAATNPAEFFAVCSEVFFEAHATLRRAYPEVYEQFVRFYRFDPAETILPGLPRG